MPVLASSAYATAEDVLNRLRTIVNDSEVAGGDVLTDAAPFSFVLLNLAYESIALELTTVGDSTFNTESWLIGLPAVTTLDPEARLIVDDSGSNIIYPNGVGNAFSNVPQLPTDLISPLTLWERQGGTANFTGPPMRQRNGGLLNMQQQTCLIDWEWKADGLRFRGALQIQDVKIEYLKRLPQLAAPTDPVPIRGVVNTAAYRAAEAFAESRGGAISPAFKITADEEIFALKLIVARRKQRKQVRRKPYGRGR
jgi:hypothetical protein